MGKNIANDVNEHLLRREAAQLLGLEPAEAAPPELVPPPKEVRAEWRFMANGLWLPSALPQSLIELRRLRWT
jgi:hypothetical protein